MDTAPTEFRASARLAIEVDYAALLRDYKSLYDLQWTPHVNQSNYSGGWDVLPLRCSQEHIDAHPILQCFAIEAGARWQNLPLLEQSEGLTALLLNLKCPINAVRFMRLKAGAHIKPHRDRGLGIEHGQARLHIPLVTDDRVTFTVAGQQVPMKAGELWYINADATHSVSNHGEQDRVNLVIDCEANAWLKEKIYAA